MEAMIMTDRLKLTLVTKAERGSQELAWLHELRSNQQTTWWSIYGTSKSIEDTEKIIRNYIPISSDGGGNPKSYRMTYAVHRLLDSENQDRQGADTEFVGLVTLISLAPTALALPEHLVLSDATAAANNTLITEIAYMFLPSGWGKGYATEAVKAVLDTCKTASSFWAPFTAVYVRSIVNEENPKSLRVMEKAGMTHMGIYEWKGQAIWLAGRWQTSNNLYIFGKTIQVG